MIYTLNKQELLINTRLEIHELVLLSAFMTTTKENDLSKVKIRLASEVLGNYQVKNNEFVPDLLREHYKLVWEKLSKHVFVKAETN